MSEPTIEQLIAALASLPAHELEATAASLEYLSQLEAQYPLALRTLWSAPAAEMDQRRAVAGVMSAPTVGIILGGWRSGKSEGLKQLSMAQSLGSGHPATRAWLELNELPRTLIPEAPSQVYVVAMSSNDSLRYHRPDFERLAPPGSRFYNRNAKGEAMLEIPVPGTRQRAKIWFKSLDQGRRAFQGISIRWAMIDEEPLGELGYGVYDELRGRVADQDGRIGIAMVPMEGLTWVHEKLLQRREDDARAFYLDTLDNPHLPRARFDRMFAGMGDDERNQRRFGRFVARQGLVYPFMAGDGTREGAAHTCDPFDVPPDWPRFRGGDWGLVLPTAVLWGALGDDDTLYVYREHYEAGPTYQQHAERCQQLEAAERVYGGWADPSEPDAIRLFRQAGVHFDRANAGPGSVKAGIDTLRDRMRVKDDGRPRLKVFTTCRNVLREISAYRWDDNRRDEVPVKKDDHAMDALRYLAQGIESWRRL